VSCMLSDSLQLPPLDAQSQSMCIGSMILARSACVGARSVGAAAAVVASVVLPDSLQIPSLDARSQPMCLG
jgi:hypothetical protein